MGNWILRWSFNKESYRPAEQATVGFWLENISDTYLFISKLGVEFDFGNYTIDTLGGVISPRVNKFLGNVGLLIPQSVVGKKIFNIKYHVHEYINGDWVDLGFYRSDRQYFISVYPMPFYKVFVSRGLRVEDKAIGNPIVGAIREWGFDPFTIGIEIEVPEEQLTSAVKEGIRGADAVIAISTPRFMDALTGLWQTLEWLHDEVGVAFGIDKPLLILKDRRVSPGGLPFYLAQAQQIPLIEFDQYNISDLKARLSAVMPEFREWIETRRRQQFFEGLKKIAGAFGLIALVSGVVGMLEGTSKRESDAQ